MELVYWLSREGAMMVSKNDLPSRTKDDPPWFPKESGEVSELSPVEVLLVQGRWPDALDRVWKSSVLKVALQVVNKPTTSRGKGKRKRTPGITLPPLEGWDTGSYLLKHNAIRI
jgi:hypothetical protein